MALPAIVKDLAQVGAHKDLYVQKGDFFVLDVEPVTGENGSLFALEDVGGLKSSLGKERAAVKTLSGEVAAWKEAVGDEKPATVGKRLQRLVKLEEFDPETEAEKRAKEKLDGRLRELGDKHKEELTAREATIQALETEVTGLLVDAEVSRVLTEEDTKGSVELLLPAFRKHVKVIQDERSGKRVAAVLDGEGNPRIKDAVGNLVTLKDLALELKKQPQYARAFDGTKASGSGAKNPVQRTVVGDDQRKGTSSVDKIRQGLEQMSAS